MYRRARGPVRVARRKRTSEAVPRRRTLCVSKSLLLIERRPRVTQSRLQGRGTSRVHSTQAAGRGLREYCVPEVRPVVARRHRLVPVRRAVRRFVRGFLRDPPAIRFKIRRTNARGRDAVLTRREK